jgi:N-glycosylase/DNA lyase
MKGSTILEQEIRRLKRSDISKEVDAKILQFEKTGKMGLDALFSELCFCLMTANFQAAKSIRLQEELAHTFASLPMEDLAIKLREGGHRFPNTRAKYICEARAIRTLLPGITGKNPAEARLWIADNVNGLGFKEASHFLRNTGCKGAAIIDFHIIDILARHKMISPLKKGSLPRKKYLEIEKILESLASRTGLNLAELDLYLWYLETGKILK